jgi:hypothetical protein
MLKSLPREHDQGCVVSEGREPAVFDQAVTLLRRALRLVVRTLDFPAAKWKVKQGVPHEMDSVGGSVRFRNA